MIFVIVPKRLELFGECEFDFKMTFIVHVLLPSVKEILHNDLGK